MVISFFSSTANAIEFSFTAPDSVDIDDDFKVSISTSESVNEDYDVKIFVHSSKEYEIPRSTYISEIYNEDKDSWADPWFYIKESFPGEKEYEIRVTESPGEQTLCVRLRQSQDNEDGYFDEKCQEIEIEESRSSSSSKEGSKDEEDEEESDLVYYSNSPSQNKEKNLQQPMQTLEEPSTISLSAPKKSTEEVTNTPQSKKTSYLIYSFLGFLFILIILLALKRL